MKKKKNTEKKQKKVLFHMMASSSAKRPASPSPHAEPAEKAARTGGDVPVGSTLQPQPPTVLDGSYVDWLVGNHPSLRPFADVLAAARDVFLRLRQVNVTVDALSNLATGTYMWPTSVAKPRKRGEVDRFFGPSQEEFVMMGRRFVRSVVDAVGEDRRIFLYGPQGVGKSHVLAAVALFCSVRRAKGEVGAPPVCYIPDMKGALGNTKYLFKCLVQAFIDQPDVLVELFAVVFDIPTLVKWATEMKSGIIFIADQCNEVGNTQQAKDVALNDFVADVGDDNWLLFAASSNQTKVDVFYVGSGGDKALKMMVEKFSYEEYCVFVRSNFAEEAALLAPNVRPAPVGQDPTLIDLVEEITGFLPLQVYQTCLAVRSRRLDGLTKNPVVPFDAGMVRQCLSVLSEQFSVDIANKINSDFFMDGKAEYLDTKVKIIALAAKCDQGFKNQIFLSKQLDWRYFYPEGSEMVAKPVSELARVAAISATVAASMKLTMDVRKTYLHALSAAMNVNPSVKGFIVETIINECLKVCDWSPLFDALGGGFPRHPSFPSNVHDFKSFGTAGYNRQGPGFEPLLLIPSVWRNPLVDAVIVYQHNNHCYVVGIQITTRTPVQHAHSLAFVTDPLGHLKFVPPGFWAGRGQPARFTVALLWIVHQENVDTLPPVNVGVHQASVPLQHFQTVCGVPIPSR